MTKYRILLLPVILFITLWISSIKTDNYIMNRIVLLDRGESTCTGVQVSYKDKTYVLTAAHCRDLAASDGSFKATTEDGTTYDLQFIAEDGDSDLLALTAVPDVPGLVVGTENYRGQSVRTFSHGSGLPTYKSGGEVIGHKTVEFIMFPIVNIQQLVVCESIPKLKIKMISQESTVCMTSVDLLATTAHMSRGGSGGAVVDGSGRIVGIIDATDGTLGFLTPINTVIDFLGKVYDFKR